MDEKLETHLVFGQIKQIETKENSNATYFGELNRDKKEHGKGILLYIDGSIYLGYFANGHYAAGSYIHILRDGSFDVGRK